MYALEVAKTRVLTGMIFFMMSMAFRIVFSMLALSLDLPETHLQMFRNVLNAATSVGFAMGVLFTVMGGFTYMIGGSVGYSEPRKKRVTAVAPVPPPPAEPEISVEELKRLQYHADLDELKRFQMMLDALDPDQEKPVVIDRRSYHERKRNHRDAE